MVGRSIKQDINAFVVEDFSKVADVFGCLAQALRSHLGGFSKHVRIHIAEVRDLDISALYQLLDEFNSSPPYSHEPDDEFLIRSDGARTRSQHRCAGGNA